MLDRTGGGKSARWWVYFGVIPPDRIVEVIDLRRGGALLADWRSLPADPLVERLVRMQQAVAALPGSTPVLDVLADGSVLAKWPSPADDFGLWTSAPVGRFTALRQAIAALPGPRLLLRLLDSGDVLAWWPEPTRRTGRVVGREPW